MESRTTTNNQYIIKDQRINPPSRSASADEKEVVNSPMLASELLVQGLP